MLAHIFFQVALDVGKFDADDLQALFDEARCVFGHTVFVFHGVAVVRIDPEVDDVDAAFQVDVVHRQADIACIFVNDGGVHTAHIVACGFVQWAVVDAHFLILDMGETVAAFDDNHAFGGYQRVTVFAIPDHSRLAFLGLDGRNGVAVGAALDIETARGVAVVDETYVNRCLVVHILVEEKVRLDVCYGKVQFFDDVLDHLVRLEEMDFLLGSAG